MNRRLLGAVAGTTAVATSVAFGAPANANAQPPASAVHSVASVDSTRAGSARPDTLPDPRAEQAAALRQAAVDQVVKGTAKIKTINGKRVIEMAAPSGKGKNAKKGRYVQYDANQAASVFTILAQFGDKVTTYGGESGPKAGKIAEPDRTKDNSTYWTPNFDRQHYLDMMFGHGESFKNFYAKQSQGRFDVEGDVTDWVTVPYNEARYGNNANETSGYWNFVNDAVNAWYAQQKAAGKTDQQIKDYLAQFDKWDRYDYDGDGNFDEPDGYIDHIQIIHAGEGEEAGGGAQGADAIWSHRWAVQTTAWGNGPSFFPIGGAPIGNSGIWVRDYTTEPENGGLGVFAHEFGHDLGLPDFYDTAGGDNSTGFWTLMSSGSWLGHGKDSIGTTPGYMGAQEKVFLGWSDVQTVPYGSKAANVTLGPADVDDKHAPQAIAVTLPDKTHVDQYINPASGSYEWWSGRGNELTNSMTRAVDLTGATSASLSANVAYDTEEGYDFLYAQVSTDGGKSFKTVPGGEITGKDQLSWRKVSFDLSAYAGQKIQFRWQYVTDQAVNGQGAFLDDITVTVDGVATTDDVEAGNGVWTAVGFQRITGTVSTQVSHYYLAEYRRYAGYDDTLRTGPYNFGFGGTDRPDWVEHFAYRPGMVVWYVDNEYADNNTSEHPGHGSVLPVDAHAKAMRWAAGPSARKLVSNRITPFDASFGTQSVPALTLHRSGAATTFPAQPAAKVFDDSKPDAYWDASAPLASTKVAGSGTRIEVKAQNDNLMRLNISFKK